MAEIEAEHHATPPEVETTEDEERRSIEEDREAPGSLCLVAIADGDVVATVRAGAEPYQRTKHFADVDSLWVRESFRRRGVAGRLLRLYERHGFAVDGRYPRDIKSEDGTYADTVAMGLLVKPRPVESPA